MYKIDTLPADIDKWSSYKSTREVINHSWNALVYTSAVFLHIVISMDRLYFKRASLAIYILFHEHTELFQKGQNIFGKA